MGRRGRARIAREGKTASRAVPKAAPVGASSGALAGGRELGQLSGWRTGSGNALIKNGATFRAGGHDANAVLRMTETRRMAGRGAGEAERAAAKVVSKEGRGIVSKVAEHKGLLGLGLGIGAYSMMRRGGATGNGYMPTGSSSGGRGYQ